jgi:hypothetical protein
MIAALGETLTVERASQIAECTAPLIRHRAKSDAEVSRAILQQGRDRELLLAASIEKHRGILTKVAKDVGLDSTQAVRYHIARSERLQSVFEECRERILDLAEENIYEAVEEGDRMYSWKFLQTIGKDRGYVERREIEKSVSHSIDAASTEALKALLNDRAGVNPEEIEAVFEELEPEDQKLLSAVLSPTVDVGVGGEEDGGSGE